MSNKVDKLFKEKLEEHTLQPTAKAWEKVEAHLGKKNKIVLWVRAAAAVMLLGVLTFVGINWNSGASEKEIAKKIGTQEPVEEQGEQKVEEKREQQQKEQPHHEIRKQKTQPKVVTPMVDKVEEQQPEQIAVVPEPEAVEEVLSQSQPDLTSHTSQPTIKKGITLTYSLPAVKKEATPQEPLVVKKTGFERVIEIAKEVKSGDALGELRQAKDDIFALDFKKEKNKKQ